MTQNSINSKQPLIQVKYTLLTSAVTVNAVIPIDGTIPQQSEGTEVMTCSITPTSATNILVIRSFVWARQTSASANFTIALFQDSTAGAIAVTKPHVVNATGWISVGTLHYAQVSGTTSATTFKIRCGRQITDFVVNSALFGGVQNSYMEVWEIKA